MEINLKRADDAFLMEGTNSDGRTTLSDGSVSIGGKNSAFRPMQLLLMSLASCSSIDVIHLLKKFRQPLEDIQINVKGEREADAVPAPFTAIHIHYKLFGDLDEKKVEKAIRMSMEQYCSAALMIRKAADITWSYEVVGGSE